MLKKFFYILAIIALFVIFWFFFVKDHREKRMTKEGNILVKKIEIFKSLKGRLPSSLHERGYEVKSGANEIYYEKHSDSTFSLSFIMSMDNNKTYYSDIDSWSYGYREMD